MDSLQRRAWISDRPGNMWLNNKFTVIDLQCNINLKKNVYNVRAELYKSYVQNKEYPQLISYASEITAVPGSSDTSQQLFSKMYTTESMFPSSLSAVICKIISKWQCHIWK
jgi:hypothetical protein